MVILNIGNSVLAKRTSKLLENKIFVWSHSSRLFRRYIKSLKRIIIDDTNKNKSLLGYYENKKKEIRIFVKNCNYFHMIEYIFLHEFSHHIMNITKQTYHGYNSLKKNLPYFKEEKKADELALHFLIFFSKKDPVLFRYVTKKIKRYEKKITHLRKLQKEQVLEKNKKLVFY